MFHDVSPPGGDFFEAVLLLSVLQCHGVLLFRNRPLELRCGAVLRAWELQFVSVQKATLGSGAASVLQCHGVLLFRKRPLEHRCGTVLRAWELHFGAGLLSVQKATLGSGACLLGAASVLQCHGVLLFRNRPQATESVKKCCFSRTSDDTLKSFLAWFWN